MVPLQLENALKSREFIHSSKNWKGILLGGAAPGAALRQLLGQLKCPVYESYGMTETASHVAIARLHPPPAEPGFELLPGMQAGSGEDGCLWVEGPVTPAGRLHTTDRVDWLTPRHFRITGRASRTINSGGLKIQPEQVCERIRELTGEPEMDIECLGLPHPKLGEEVVLTECGTRIRDWDSLLKKETRRELRRAFPGKVYQLAAWPRTASFKTDFPALKKELAGMQPVWTRPASL
jgi:O-succinylbenzoic acid--CoA ligase